MRVAITDGMSQSTNEIDRIRSAAEAQELLDLLRSVFSRLNGAEKDAVRNMVAACAGGSHVVTDQR
jgi:hypothetical protein